MEVINFVKLLYIIIFSNTILFLFFIYIKNIKHTSFTKHVASTDLNRFSFFCKRRNKINLTNINNIFDKNQRNDSNITIHLQNYKEPVFEKFKDILIKQTYGEDFPNLHFLIIRRNEARYNGIFSHYITNLGWIKFAVENNFIPVIDMISYQNILNSKNENKYNNPWELFFKQPYGYTITDIKTAKNIYLTDKIQVPGDRPYDTIWFVTNKTLVETFHNLSLKYMKLVDSINKEVILAMQKLFSGNTTENGLCVRLRGTDYNLNIKGHPIPPQTKEVINDIIIYEKSHRVDWIYLAVEDKSILDEFIYNFGDKLKTFSQNFSTYNRTNEIGEEIDGNINASKNYLISIIILSKCKNVFTSRNSAMAATIVLSDGFNFIKYYDKGTN